jgi:signal transduction histidine kinase
VYASQAEQAGVRYSFTAPPQAQVVTGDSKQLYEAIGNLLENGLKFTPAGGEVRLILDRDGSWAIVIVEDTGIGLPPEDLPRLFERFHRGRNAAGYPGSGLGLAIVRSIVESHGGAVTAENLQPGARFVIRLPLLVQTP